MEFCLKHLEAPEFCCVTIINIDVIRKNDIKIRQIFQF